MKNNSISTKHTLFSLANDNNTSAQFSIYYNATQKLICSPFSNSTTSPVLTFTDAAANYLGEWQHILCMFSSTNELQGVYTNPEHEFVYIKDLTGTSNKLPMGQYKISIGNNIDMNNSTILAYFKEVRVWTDIRTREENSKYMWQ